MNKTNCQGLAKYLSGLALMLWVGQANALLTEITDVYAEEKLVNSEDAYFSYSHTLVDNVDFDASTDFVDSASITIELADPGGSEVITLELGDGTPTTTYENIPKKYTIYAGLSSVDGLNTDPYQSQVGLFLSEMATGNSGKTSTGDFIFKSSTLTAQVTRTTNSQVTGTTNAQVTTVPAVQQIPEPGTFALLSLGLAVLGFTRRRMRA
jgi:hypothetical protein